MPLLAGANMSLWWTISMGSTMPAPHKFSRKLHEVIGAEAAEAMVEWMNRTDDKLDEVKHELGELRQTVRADIAELRQEMAVGFAKVEAEFAKVEARFANVESAAAQRQADFMKWMLAFWVASLVTYVGAIVALAKVIR